MTLKTGALSKAEIQQVWEGSVDKGYRDPLVRAGEGGGFEAWTQLFAQFERASKAIDITTQAMFILPHSAQTNPPAAGGAKATVKITLARSKRMIEPLFLQAGFFVVEEQTTDAAPGAGVLVKTGRRYVLTEDVFFAPGDEGPYDATFEADRTGYGHNNPLSGTITAIEQKGSNFENDHATVEISTPFPAPVDFTATTRTTVRIIAANEPDMFIPEHVGQYVVFTGGNNATAFAGTAARMTKFDSPLPPTVGSAQALEFIFCLTLMSPPTSPIVAGDILYAGSPAGTVVRVLDYRVVHGRPLLSVVYLNGSFFNLDAGNDIAVPSVGPVATVRFRDFFTPFVAEAPSFGVGGADWRILDWVQDWGLTASNALQPEGGIAPFLDELGNERKLGRTPGEDDESYRRRVHQIADVVTPNAIRRAVNRAIPGFDWSFHEAGQESLRGFFFDGTNEAPAASPHGAANDAYDTDTMLFVGAVTSGSFQFQEEIVLENKVTFASYMYGRFGGPDGSGSPITFIRRTGRIPTSFVNVRIRGLWSGATFDVSSVVENTAAEDRLYRCWLSYADFRAFFLIVVPSLGFGEFGFPYDAPLGDNGYDLLGSYQVAYDGYPRLGADVYRRIYNSVEGARAGGVGWELRRLQPQNPIPA